MNRKNYTSFREVLEVHGKMICSPVTGSMRPLIRPKTDYAVLKKVDRPLRKYDVVIYTSGEKTVLHRVIGVPGENTGGHDSGSRYAGGKEADGEASGGVGAGGRNAGENGSDEKNVDKTGAGGKSTGGRDPEGKGTDRVGAGGRASGIYLIRGDANTVSERIPAEQIYGVMEGMYRGERYVSCDSVSYQLLSRLIVAANPLIVCYKKTRRLLSRIRWLRALYRRVKTVPGKKSGVTDHSS